MRLLIIEDEHQLARNIQKYLLLEKFAVDIAFDGSDGLEQAMTNDYDCIMLDLNLPSVDGTEICKTLRGDGKTMPIIMLTARTGTENIVLGLDSGADDYLVKPFDLEELTARIRALVRRKSADRQPILRAKSIEMDTNTQEVRKENTLVKLAPKEFVLFEFLLRNKGLALTRTSIIGHVWGAEEDKLMFSQTLDVHIAYLRKKLGKKVIETVPGIGYKVPNVNDV